MRALLAAFGPTAALLALLAVAGLVRISSQ